MTNIFSVNGQVLAEQASRFYCNIEKDSLLTADVIKYEYFDNSDPYTQLFAFENNDQIVGVAGAIGFDLIKQGKIVRSLMLERSLVKRRYWGAGVFESLEKQVSTYARSVSAALIWGRGAISKAFERVAYSIAYDLVDLRFNLDKKAFSNPIVAAYSFEEGYDDELNAFIKKMSRQHPEQYFLSYTADKVNWLIEKNPYIKRKIIRIYDESNKLHGYFVLRSPQSNMLWIEDILLDDLSMLDSVMYAVSAEAKLSGVNTLAFRCNVSSPLLMALVDKLLLQGFDSTTPDVCMYIKSLSDEKIQADALYMTGIWAPPYWAVKDKF